MNESPKELLTNPAQSFQLNEIVNQRKESGHSSYDHSNRYEKARPAQGSNRVLFAMVIIVCLISLAASLLLTVLALDGKISCSNEGQCTG